MNNENKTLQHPINSSRKYWLDCLRALAMIMVVLVHASNGLPHWDKYNVFVGPVMLPLFFAISGYLFNACDGKQGIFYKRILFKLVIPWVVLSLIWARACLIPFKGFAPYFTQHLYNFISGETLWYFSCCIIAEIIQFYVVKFSKKFNLICLVDIILCAIGFVLAHFKIGDFLNINIAFIAQFFIMLGYIFKNYEDIFSKLRWEIVSLLAIAYVGLAVISIIVFPGQYIDVHRNMYPNIPLYLALIIVGVLTLFTLAKKANIRFKIAAIIGQNTLVIYSMHSFGLSIVTKVMSFFGIALTQNWLIAVILTASSILLCCIGAIVLNNLLPEAVGRRRRKRVKSENQDISPT